MNRGKLVKMGKYIRKEALLDSRLRGGESEPRAWGKAMGNA